MTYGKHGILACKDRGRLTGQLFTDVSLAVCCLIELRLFYLPGYMEIVSVPASEHSWTDIGKAYILVNKNQRLR
jgi:hypothetical protein